MYLPLLSGTYMLNCLMLLETLGLYMTMVPQTNLAAVVIFNVLMACRDG